MTTEMTDTAVAAVEQANDDKPGLVRLTWIFMISCVVGYCVEEVWCYIRHGYFESRQSLVYGPISVVYGMGAVILTLALYRLRKLNPAVIFIAAFAAGTVTEYIASLGQEIVFGSVAWDYSDLPFNINGRVCLYYSLMWGALGLIWIKAVYPLLSSLLSKLKPKTAKIIAIAFAVFFVFDCAMSAGAGLRMDQRKKDVPADNFIQSFFDERFPDERMRRIYANSKDV